MLPHDPRGLGSYELVGRLGSGGQGTVYLGRGPDGQLVAVKLLRVQFDEDGSARTRFIREAEVAKQVARFCTAQILDADTIGDSPYLVSEYVAGPALSTQVERAGPLSGGALDRLAVSTASALAAIHRAGIVHRDLKPPNVLLGPDGPRVIDFGLSRMLDVATAASSKAFGTPAYMAPEQITGEDVGAAADVFAWGATMTFAATGRPPFGADSIHAVIHRVLHNEPDLGALDGRLRELVAAAMAKEPAARPTAAQLMLRMVGHDEAFQPAGVRVDDGPLVPPPRIDDPQRTADPQETSPIVPRRPRGRLVGTVAVVGAAALVGAGGFTFASWPEERERGRREPGVAAQGGGVAAPTVSPEVKARKRAKQNAESDSRGTVSTTPSGTPKARTTRRPKPSGGPSKPPMPKPRPVRLGSPDPDRYCKAGDPDKSAVFRSGQWYCVHDTGIGVDTVITMTQVCRSQWSPYAEARLAGDADTPGDWECYVIE
ncbi:serine/threonine protein kinase [Actinomadura rudentiformis]|uniref:Serine/threonine protein kinase n=1 Tax=Actinomadura rudentiformis TaxID=359158 RepID=A0A6H9YRK8_9ACTN|nr:serine/threonine protein kinase [Actinomadura rudentiformis]